LIQIGNETNKGILLSPEDNAVWTLDWERNAILFNHAIKAVNDVEKDTGEDIKIVLHVADPANAGWLVEGFIKNGVTNFDIIGLSYYWAWHQPTTIPETGQVIQNLRNLYSDKEVLIVETGYIWTIDSNDDANNIISETHPDYQPINSVNQRDWLIDLAQEVINSDGVGVIYWEPCWVSNPCFTQWGQGSHQEHAAFFDFDNQLMLPGGIEWMSHDYHLISSQKEDLKIASIEIFANNFSGNIQIKQNTSTPKQLTYSVADTLGGILMVNSSIDEEINFKLENLPFGIYIISVKEKATIIKSKKIIFSQR